VTVTIPETNSQKYCSINLTELLLTSDLTGNIPSPAYFINTAGPQVKEHADLLMLTNGWKRFVWADLTEKELPKNSFYQRRWNYGGRKDNP
jgi:phosphoglycerate dehydrogenase-like enzyme